MDKIFNFFKKPAIATFFTVLSGSILLLVYWMPVAQENFFQQNLWKSGLITIVYFIELQIAVQRRSYRLLYFLILLTVLALIFSSLILTSDAPISDWREFLRVTLFFASIFIPPVGIVSAALVWLLSLVKRENKFWYYLIASMVGAILGAVAAALGLFTYGIVHGLLCSWRGWEDS